MSQKKIYLNNSENLKDDVCTIGFETSQSIRPGLYGITQFKSPTCEAPEVTEFATRHPTLISQDGYGWTSINGCNIDRDSSYRNDPNRLTNKGCIQQLQPRVFQNEPYKGRGNGNIDKESFLKTCCTTRLNQPVKTDGVMDMTHFNLMPMLPTLTHNIQNPIHIIPEDNCLNWIRGGLPSRQIIQNINYKETCLQK